MNKPLRGKRILVTRPAGQAGELAQMIAAQGGIFGWVSDADRIVEALDD